MSDDPIKRERYFPTFEHTQDEEKHFAAIGRLSSEWALFELDVDFNMLSLAGIDKRFGLCLTAQITGMTKKLEAYIAIAKIALPSLNERKLNKLFEKVRALAEQRNRIIHDPWLFEETNGPFRQEITARRVLRIKPVPVSTADVWDIIKQIDRTSWEFDCIHTKVLEALEALKASPETTR